MDTWDTPWNRKVMRGLFNKYWDGYVKYCSGVSKGKPKNFLRYILDQEKEDPELISSDTK